MKPKDPQAELRETIKQKLLFAGKHRSTNVGYYTNRPKDYPPGKVLDEALDKDENYVLGKYADEILALFQAHQQELLSELLPTKDRFSTAAYGLWVEHEINRRIGELNG